MRRLVLEKKTWNILQHCIHTHTHTSNSDFLKSGNDGW